MIREISTLAPRVTFKERFIMRCKKCGAKIEYTSSQDGVYWSCQDCGQASEEEL